MVVTVVLVVVNEMVCVKVTGIVVVRELITVVVSVTGIRSVRVHENKE